MNFALNATGRIKTPLQVINKSKQPKCFLAKHNGGETWDPKKHSITYHHNPTAWQTRSTFTRRKAGILPFEVNQWYIEDKEVSKGMLRKAADHLTDLFGKLNTVFSESEEAVREFDSAWLTEEGMDALDCVGSCGTD